MTQVSSPNTSLIAVPVDFEAGAVNAGISLARRACQAWSGQAGRKAADADDNEDPSSGKDMPAAFLPLGTTTAMSMVVGVGAGSEKPIRKKKSGLVQTSQVVQTAGQVAMPQEARPAARSHHAAQLRQSQQLQQSTGQRSIPDASKASQSSQDYCVVAVEQGAHLASDTGAPPAGDTVARGARMQKNQSALQQVNRLTLTAGRAAMSGTASSATDAVLHSTPSVTGLSGRPVQQVTQLLASNLPNRSQKLLSEQHVQPPELLEPEQPPQLLQQPQLVQASQLPQLHRQMQSLQATEQSGLPQLLPQPQPSQQSAQLPQLPQPTGKLPSKASPVSLAGQEIEKWEAALTVSPVNSARPSQSLLPGLHPAMPSPSPLLSSPEPSLWPPESASPALALPSSLLAEVQSALPFAELLAVPQMPLPQTGMALPIPVASETAPSSGPAPRAPAGSAQGTVAAEAPAPRTADGASSLTYRFNSWNDGHSVTVRSMAGPGVDGGQYTLLPSDRLVEQRLAAQWPTAEIGRDRHDARWLLAAADTAGFADISDIAETLVAAETDGPAGRQPPSERHEREDRRNRRQPLPQYQDDEEPE